MLQKPRPFRLHKGETKTKDNLKSTILFLQTKHNLKVMVLGILHFGFGFPFRGRKGLRGLPFASPIRPSDTFPLHFQSKIEREGRYFEGG
jgi:hypothetical protein